MSGYCQPENESKYIIRRPRGERGLAPEQVVPVSCGTSANLSPACQLGPASEGRLCGLVFGAQPSPAQPSPAHSPAQALVWALPKLCQRLFPILPNAFSYWIQTYRFPAQPSTAQLVHPSLGVGLAKALPKAFSYRIWPVSGRPAAAFPCFEGVGLDCRSAQPKALSPAQVSPSPGQPNPGQVSPAQLTAARPKPWCGPCRTLCKGFSYRIQRCHFRPRDGSVFGAFLARLGPPCRCVWLFWRVHVWCVLGAPKCRQNPLLGVGGTRALAH